MKSLRTALGEHRALLLVLTLQIAVSWWVCSVARHPLFVGLRETYDSFLSAIPLYGLGVLAVALVRLRMTLAPDAPMRVAYARAWKRVIATVWRRQYVVGVVIAFASLPLSLAIFSAAKRAIPVVHPFTWDARIERIGRAIHGGQHAWQWLLPVISNEPLMRAADGFYHVVWPFAIFGAAVVVALFPPCALRSRYLVASVLTWCFVGTLGALVFSSAGPAYYAQVTGDPRPYGGLFVALGHAHVPALQSQQALWRGYQTGLDRFGFGVSAMPSVHVATATLLACLGWAVHRVLGWILSLGAVLTLVASVALGWHYALDGYVGALLAIGVWCIAGRLDPLPSHTAALSRPPRRLLTSGELSALSP